MVACGSNNDGRCDVSDWKLFDNFDDVVNRAVAEKDKREAKREAAAEKRRIDRIAVLEAEKQRIEAELPHINGLFSCGKRQNVKNRQAEIEKELRELNLIEQVNGFYCIRSVSGLRRHMDTIERQ